MTANVLNDWQYEDMYRQKAIAIPAIMQFVREDVLRTNLAAKGIVIAWFISMEYLSEQLQREHDVGDLLCEVGVLACDPKVWGRVDSDYPPEVHEAYS